MVKKEEILNPIVQEKTQSTVDKDKILSALKGMGVIKEEGGDDVDSYFKSIIDNLFSDTNIELKTEYRTVEENFVGAKLDFMSRFCRIPGLKEWLNTWERKRVSFERKSRIEIIRALEHRREEMERQTAQTNLKNMLGFE